MWMVVFILSVFFTSKVCKRINRNTIGTTKAYIFRAWIAFIFVFGAVSFVFAALGLVS